MMKKLYTLSLLIFALCAGAAAQPQWGVNLVTNPGFSDGMTGWTRGDGCTNGIYSDDDGALYYPYGGCSWRLNASDGAVDSDTCLAFSIRAGEVLQSFSFADCGFASGDLDGASAVVSVEAYFKSFGVPALSFSACFQFLGENGTVAAAAELIPDSCHNGLPSWTTFCRHIQLPSGVQGVRVTLRGCSGVWWAGYYGPRFDNVSVSIIRGGATALPASPVVADDASAPVFDLQGRRVASPVRGRPYVQGGRLKVVR